MNGGINGPGKADDPILAVLQLLADGPRLLATYQEYAEKKADYQKVLDQVGPAMDIVQLRRELAKQLEDVPKTKEAAQTEARLILENAGAEARGIVQAARDEATALANDSAAKVSQADETVRKARGVMAEADKARQQVEAERAQLATAQQKLEEEQSQLEADQQQLAADRARLEEALSNAQNLLKG